MLCRSGGSGLEWPCLCVLSRNNPCPSPQAQRSAPYEIQSPLGAGGMGEVYKARDTRLDRTVAIKVLLAHVADDPDLRRRFEREAKTISSLNHPHIWLSCLCGCTVRLEANSWGRMAPRQGRTPIRGLDRGKPPVRAEMAAYGRLSSGGQHGSRWASGLRLFEVWAVVRSRERRGGRGALAGAGRGVEGSLISPIVPARGKATVAARPNCLAFRSRTVQDRGLSQRD